MTERRDEEETLEKLGLPEVSIEITAAEYKGAGRPTKYRPEFCDVAVERGMTGASRAQIASWLNVRRTTIAKWEQDHPEFLVAMQEAADHALAWYESAGQRGMFRKGFSGQSWSLQMRNRFPAEYRDEKTVNVRTHEDQLTELE